MDAPPLFDTSEKERASSLSSDIRKVIALEIMAYAFSSDGKMLALNGPRAPQYKKVNGSNRQQAIMEISFSISSFIKI
jgi:hypothetical protein